MKHVRNENECSNAIRGGDVKNQDAAIKFTAMGFGASKRLPYSELTPS